MADENTIKTYQTKGFNNEGVKNSTPVSRLDENGTKGITTQVMEENKLPVEKIVKDEVKSVSAGEGMPKDSGKVKK